MIVDCILYYCNVKKQAELFHYVVLAVEMNLQSICTMPFMFYLCGADLILYSVFFPLLFKACLCVYSLLYFCITFVITQ